MAVSRRPWPGCAGPTRLLAAVPPGSYLAIAHPASDISDQMTQYMRRYNQQVTAPVTARTHAEVCRFFHGLDQMEPAVVQLQRPAPRPTRATSCTSNWQTWSS